MCPRLPKQAFAITSEGKSTDSLVTAGGAVEEPLRSLFKEGAEVGTEEVML